MRVARPTGGYAEQMLDPDAWPEVDEDAFYDRAQQYTRVLHKVTEVLETCKQQQAEVFDGGVWSGSAAGAANGELVTNIGELGTLQNGLATVITWQTYIALSIVQAKSDISDNVEAAHAYISRVEKDVTLTDSARTESINSALADAYTANLGVVETAAERILQSKSWKPPENALQDLLDQKLPPEVEIPETDPDERDDAQPSRPVTPPSPVTPPPSPIAPVTPPSPGAPDVAPRPTPPITPGVPGGTPVPPVTPTIPGGTVPSVPGLPGGGSSAPPPLSPAAATQPLGSGGGLKGMRPASASGPSVAARPEETTSAAPAGAGGMAPMAPGAGGASGGSRSRGGAPVGQASPGTRPAAAASRPAGLRAASAGQTKSTDSVDSGEVVPVPPPIIPVSKARAERDAMAEAATADASRRESGGLDPLRLATRIAAALNAPGVGGGTDLGFFWVTGVTTEGAIVVANSYGVAYIPDGVLLPEQVYLASADDAIPAAERARWATYPMMAVQGWANHHNIKLRAVIGTEEQLANSDAGAPKVVLAPDDIPEAGTMAGRSRLEVVDPEAAQRLAAATDVRLVELLPPAPAGAELSAGQRPAFQQVGDPEVAARLDAALTEGSGNLTDVLTEMPAPPQDAGPPDRRPMLWFNVMKPLASKSAGRQAPHLKAFRGYAAAAEEAVLHEAHTAADPANQRAAISDWLYWQYVNRVLEAATATAS